MDPERDQDWPEGLCAHGREPGDCRACEGVCEHGNRPCDGCDEGCFAFCTHRIAIGEPCKQCAEDPC